MRCISCIPGLSLLRPKGFERLGSTGYGALDCGDGELGRCQQPPCEGTSNRAIISHGCNQHLCSFVAKGSANCCSRFWLGMMTSSQSTNDNSPTVTLDDSSRSSSGGTFSVALYGANTWCKLLVRVCMRVLTPETHGLHSASFSYWLRTCYQVNVWDWSCYQPNFLLVASSK